VTLDTARVARVLVLGAWTTFFVWLSASGEVVRYIGPRTQWVVFFGTAALAVATVAYALTLRRTAQHGLTRREAAGLALLLVPIAAVALVPAPELGALAAARRSAGPLAGVSLVPSATRGEISFLEVDYASRSQEYAASAGVTEGRRLELLGFVSRVDSDGFDLTRFYIACCAADAIPYTVAVEAPGGSTRSTYSTDQWFEVSGTLEREQDGAFILVADRLRRRDAPENPYLS
jgi:uncharacterized repeat protein (TIGR03943 family)